eukprot:153874_1
MDSDSTKFRRLMHYEELVVKTQNDKIELAKCIKDQYSQQLTSHTIDRNQNHKMIIATMCIQDLWRWIHENGMDAIRNNQYLQTEINEMKSIQSRHYSQQTQWERFCNELKNENNKLKNDMQNMQQNYDAMINEYRDLKHQNEILMNQIKMDQAQVARQQKAKEFNEIKAIITGALQETQVIQDHGNYVNISNENADHDTIALLCQIVKNQDQRLIEFRQNHSSEGSYNAPLELSDYQDQHFDPADGEDSCEENHEMESVYGENDDQDVYDDGANDINNEFKYKLYKLFAKYQVAHDPDTHNDLNCTLNAIERVCKDAYKYQKAYVSANKEIQKLKHRLGWKMSNPSKKRLIARKKGCHLSKKSKSLHRRNKSCPMSMPMVDPMQILSELTEDLLSLMKYLRIVQNNNQYEYCIHKIESLCSSLQDLANDIGSPLLQNAVNILKSLKHNIFHHSNTYKCNNQSLHDIINQTKNTISDLYHNNMTMDAYAPSISVVIDRVEGHESLVDIMDEDDEDYDMYEAPYVESIQTDGHCSNKAAKAVIVYKGKKYKRNMKAFEWLSRVLLVRSGGPDTPKLSKSVSTNEWDAVGLKKKRRELNRYLKQCHGTKWIRQFDGYYKIFFAKSYKEWKILRTKFDRKISMASHNKK